ncbi:MAG TPA: metallophosphoesterase [Armatimonadota bacterium]|jgi:hypothetical protein
MNTPRRKTWLRASLATLLALVLLGALLWPGPPQVESVTVTLPHLPAAEEGLRVAVIADFHGGFPWRRVNAVAPLVAQVNALRPDLILLLGDMVHWSESGPEFVPALAGLRAPRGVYACLGNHEHRRGWWDQAGNEPGPLSSAGWAQLYAAAGITLLNNAARPVGGAGLWLVGVDDPRTGRQDLGAALRGVPPGACCLLLAHSPDIVDDPLAPRADLIVAGHTHGGQVRLPGIPVRWGPYRHPERRAAGLDRENGTQMYVTRGVGEGLPVRFRCPREITLLTLRGPG